MILVNFPALLQLMQLTKRAVSAPRFEMGSHTPFVLWHHTQLCKPGRSSRNLRDLGMAQEATYSCPLELLCALLIAAVQNIICFLVAPLHCLTIGAMHDNGGKHAQESCGREHCVAYTVVDGITRKTTYPLCQ